MDKKDFYRIMGLSFLEGPVLQELIKDGANPDFAEDIEKLRNKADEVYEEINKNPVGIVDGTLDDKMYELTQAISAMTSYTLDLIPLELPRNSSISEARLNDYKKSIDDANVHAQVGFRVELKEELENHPEVKKYVEEERKIQEQKEQELRREEEEKERQREQQEREENEKLAEKFRKRREEMEKEEEERRIREHEEKYGALERERATIKEKLENNRKQVNAKEIERLDNLKELEEEKKLNEIKRQERVKEASKEFAAQKEKYEAESKQKDLEWENEKKAFKEAADQRTKEYVESDAVKADIKRQLEEIKNRVEQKTKEETLKNRAEQQVKEETLKNGQEVPDKRQREEINNVAKQAAETLKNRPEGIDKRQLEELINRAKQQVEETLKNRQEASADVEEKVEQQLKEVKNRVKQANEANKERREEVEKELIATKFSPKGLFDNNINKLIGARTRVNSNQYDELIKIVSNVNDGVVRNNGTYTPRESYVVQLLAIKSSINNYLNHKAEKGVKQNSFKKLDAVEELNAEVTKRLTEVKCDKFFHNGKPVIISKAPLTYDDEEKVFTKKYKNSEIKTPERMGEKALNECVNKAKANYPDANANTMRRVDDCMCRILLASYKGGKVGRHSKDINEMRKQFREHPDNIKYTERKENKQKEQKKQGIIKK